MATSAAATESRKRKLSRRHAIDPAVGFPAVQVTTPDTVVRPSEHQQERRKTAIRYALRFAHLLHDVMLQNFAERHDWDVLATISAIRKMDLIRRSNPNSPAVPGFLRWCQCEPANTVGGSRLKLLDVYRRVLNSLMPAGHLIDASDSVLLGFLQRCRWLKDKATKLWQERPCTLDEIVDRHAALSTPNPSTGQKCERLAAFMSMTSTESPYSAVRFLETHDWIYTDAINVWSEEGKLPLVLAEGPSRGLREVIVSDHPFHILNGRDLPTDPTTATPDNVEVVPSRASHLAEVQIEEEAPAQDVQEMYKELEADYPRGWIIDMDEEPAELGIRDAQKLRIEYIHGGLEYRCIWAEGMKGKSFDLDDDITDDESEREEFDFDNKKKIGLLTRWRNEWRLKLGEEPKKPEAVKFLPVERDWIYEQLQGHVEEVYQEKLKQAAEKKYPGFALGQLGENKRRELGAKIRPWFDSYKNWPLPMSQAAKERITLLFNEVFAGKTELDNVIICGIMYDNDRISDAPRPERSLNAINIERNRIARACRDFGLRYGPAHEVDAAAPEHGTDTEPENEAGFRAPARKVDSKAVVSSKKRKRSGESEETDEDESENGESS